MVLSLSSVCVLTVFAADRRRYYWSLNTVPSAVVEQLNQNPVRLAIWRLPKESLKVILQGWDVMLASEHWDDLICNRVRVCRWMTATAVMVHGEPRLSSVHLINQASILLTVISTIQLLYSITYHREEKKWAIMDTRCICNRQFLLAQRSQTLLGLLARSRKRDQVT